MDDLQKKVEAGEKEAKTMTESAAEREQQLRNQVKMTKVFFILILPTVFISMLHTCVLMHTQQVNL